MKPSPARALAPEPESWLPIDSLESLPELEDLLDPRLLVDSGQTRAVKVGADGIGYFSSKTEAAPSFDSRAHTRRKRLSKHRTLKLKRRAKYQRLVSAVLAVVVLSSAIAFYLDQNSTDNAYATENSLATIPQAVPIYVPVVIEGEKEMRLSVAQDLQSFIEEQNLGELASVSAYFSRANYTTKRTAPAMEFNFVKELKINVDGKSVEVKTSGLTVGDVLNERGVVVKGNDIVTPSIESRAMGVEAITIQRVTTQTRTEERVVPFITQRQNDSSLAKGKTKEVQRGVNGKEEVTITQTIADGNVIEEKITDSREIVAPKPRIIKVGTKSTASSNNTTPRASNSSRGSETGIASFYAPPKGGGTCAHKTLPFGTIITVTNVNNGKSTTCRVADRGPFIAGRVIDLSREGFAAIAPLSSGVTTVRLSW